MLAYRADVDGLRAIAVTAVVLFHANVAGLTGGFVGVDVFFVISGYLITSIAVGEMKRGRFSAATFYERRIRRIFPPLMAMLLLTWIAAYLMLLPSEMKDLGDTFEQTSIFASNFGFWRDSDYFAADAETKPLLHLWSLCVEEQFYLVFPACLLLGMRLGTRLRIAFGLILFAASLAVSQLQLASDASAAFYLPHSRAWELLLGAAIGFVPAHLFAARPIRELAGGAGLVAIAASIVGYSKDTAFPGVTALAPCMGAALIIASGAAGPTVVKSLLSSRPFVSVGLISYALYLWHWPILVLCQKWVIDPLSGPVTAGAVAAAVVLAIATRYAIEEPVRRRAVLSSSRVVFTFGGLSLAATFLVGFAASSTQGMPGRVPEQVAKIAQLSSSKSIIRTYCLPGFIHKSGGETICDIGTKSATPTLFVWGDSHAGAWSPVVAKVATDRKVRATVASRGACPPLLEVGIHEPLETDACVKFNRNVLTLASKSQYETVGIAARWGIWAQGTRYGIEQGATRQLYDAVDPSKGMKEPQAVMRRGLARTIEALQGLRKRVVLLGPIPEVGYDVPIAMARVAWLGLDLDIRPSREAFNRRQHEAKIVLKAMHDKYGVEIVYPHKPLCKGDFCRIERHGMPIYQDNNHLNRKAIPLLASAVTPLFEASGPSEEPPTPADKATIDSAGQAPHAPMGPVVEP